MDPWLGDKVNPGIGLSNRHARLHGWRAGVTLSPSQGSMKSATGLNGIYLPMQLADWPIIEVAKAFIGLTHISLDRNQFWPSRKRSIVF